MAARNNNAARNWCFTVNNWKEADLDVLKTLGTGTQVKYMVVGKEVGESGTPHLQGFVVFQKTERFGAVKKVLPPGCHIEKAKGTWEHNLAYCTKEDKEALVMGEAPMSRKRQGEAGAEAEKERWLKIRALAKEGKTEELEMEFPREATLYSEKLARIHMKCAPRADLPSDTVVGVWIHGPSGAGKSYWCHHHLEVEGVKYDINEIYDKDLSQWWDGWRIKDEVEHRPKHRVAYLDDLDKFNIKLARDLKVWTQEYEFNAQVKGDYLRIRPELVVVTSQSTIEEIWEDDKTRCALLRRFRVGYKANREAPVVWEPMYVPSFFA
ncbi:replication-associated protein [Crucivirus-152]|nr:replication-associated protein [Crucivirus-152]